MLRSKTNRIGMLALVLCALALAALPALAQEDGRYATTTLRGKLAEGKGRPLAGALVRFVTVPGGQEFTTVTDGQGRFVLKGLPYSNYAVDLTTAEGERIYGVNDIPISKDQVNVTMSISPRRQSDTTLGNDSSRFFVVVDQKKSKWKRFWKQFGIFFGVAAAGAVAAG